MRPLSTFASLSNERLRLLIRDMQYRSFDSGKLIVRRYLPPKYIYVVISGMVKVVMEDDNGTERTIAVHDESDTSFGEQAVLYNARMKRTSVQTAEAAVQAAAATMADLGKAATLLPLSPPPAPSSRPSSMRSPSPRAKEAKESKDAHAVLAKKLATAATAAMAAAAVLKRTKERKFFSEAAVPYNVKACVATHVLLVPAESYFKHWRADSEKSALFDELTRNFLFSKISLKELQCLVRYAKRQTFTRGMTICGPLIGLHSTTHSARGSGGKSGKSGHGNQLRNMEAVNKSGGSGSKKENTSDTGGGGGVGGAGGGGDSSGSHKQQQQQQQRAELQFILSGECAIMRQVTYNDPDEHSHPIVLNVGTVGPGETFNEVEVCDQIRPRGKQAHHSSSSSASSSSASSSSSSSSVPSSSSYSFSSSSSNGGDTRGGSTKKKSRRAGGARTWKDALLATTETEVLSISVDAIRRWVSFNFKLDKECTRDVRVYTIL